MATKIQELTTKIQELLKPRCDALRGSTLNTHNIAENIKQILIKLNIIEHDLISHVLQIKGITKAATYRLTMTLKWNQLEDKYKELNYKMQSFTENL